MTDAEITERLRAKGAQHTPTEVAALLNELASGGLTGMALIVYFRRAFPKIPLSTLKECAAWRGVGGQSMDDAAFNAVLGKWLPSSAS